MSCLSNHYIKNPKDGSWLPVSCGKCALCRVKRSVDWRVRLGMERFTQRNYGSSFVTLTYSDRFLPSDYSCRIEEVQKAIKRFRYYCKNKKGVISPTFKYFLTSEYGDETARPHYHCILCGVNTNTARRVFQDSWKYGFVHALPLMPYRIRYVVDYVTIYDLTPEAKDSMRLDGIEPPQDIFSNGIAKQYMLDNLDFAQEHGFYFFDGKKWIPPSYWRNKLNIDFDPISMANQRIEMLRQYGINPDKLNNDIFTYQLAENMNRKNKALNRRNYKILDTGLPTVRPDIGNLAKNITFFGNE